VHHRLPYSKLLARDEALRDMLHSIKLPKLIFTNADQKHAAICLELLGLADCFQARLFWLPPARRPCVARGVNLGVLLGLAG